MNFIQPPHINGSMSLTEEERQAIKNKLKVIIDNFEPTIEQGVIDSFYITSTYNRENGDFPINGDTAQELVSELNVVKEEVTEEVGE